MHAVLRLTLGRVIPNVQASWVKLGRQGAIEMLSTGANDLGGVLINESITRAAGAAHGQMWPPRDIEQAVVAAGRVPVQRNTRYEPAASQGAGQLCSDAIKWVSHTPAGRQANPKYRSAI
jgi:FO synthase